MIAELAPNCDKLETVVLLGEKKYVGEEVLGKVEVSAARRWIARLQQR